MPSRRLHQLARAVVLSVVGAVGSTAVAVTAIQAVTRRWSLHNTLDAGGATAVLAMVTSMAVCWPFFARLPYSALRTPMRASLLGGAIASIAGVLAVAWFFADGIYPQGVGGWLRVMATPFFAPFPVVGACFGYGWSTESVGREDGALSGS